MKACTVLICKAGVSNPAPGDLPSDRFQLQPQSNTPEPANHGLQGYLFVSDWCVCMNLQDGISPGAGLVIPVIKSLPIYEVRPSPTTFTRVWFVFIYGELTCSSGKPSQSLQHTHTHVRPSVTGKHERLTATCMKTHHFSALTGAERSPQTQTCMNFTDLPLSNLV